MSSDEWLVTLGARLRATQILLRYTLGSRTYLNLKISRFFPSSETTL